MPAPSAAVQVCLLSARLVAWREPQLPSCPRHLTVDGQVDSTNAFSSSLDQLMNARLVGYVDWQEHGLAVPDTRIQFCSERLADFSVAICNDDPLVATAGEELDSRFAYSTRASSLVPR